MSDLVWPLRHRTALRAVMQDGRISFSFRERLMLAVTQVNECRYCSQYHSGEALKAGLSPQETRAILVGDLHAAPANELPALLYAQHWADQDGRPAPDVREKLLGAYSSEQADAIETVLHMIRIGNLAGNTVDYLLYRLSFGRRGLTASEAFGPLSDHSPN
jgi:AhpD family alkylhydroperoxidase